MNFTLKKLRNHLSDYQIELLSLFWKHCLETERWPAPLDIHQDHPKKEVMAALRSMGGQPSFAGHIVQAGHTQYGPDYELTLIGILLTKDGEKYESWLVNLFQFFQTEYYQEKKPAGTTEYDEREIGEALKLNESESQILGRIARFGISLSVQAYSQTVGGNWKIRLPHDIDDLPKNGSAKTYFDEMLFRYCKQQKWVFHIDGINQTEIIPDAATKSFIQATRPYTDEMPIETSEVFTNSKIKRSKSADIFISHSGQDRDLAIALTDLLKAAFPLRAEQILCTSVPGHKLVGGAHTEAELLDVLRNAEIVIGVMTPASLESSYVLFELGARWGMQKSLIPLVARGTKMEDLVEPLKSKNALNASDEGDLHQFIENIAKFLKPKKQPAAAYTTKIRSLISSARKPSEKARIKV
jgi:hypothetical protein